MKGCLTFNLPPIEMNEDAKQEMNVWLCRRNAARCRYCDRASSRLCDFEIADGKTCDVPMCDFCTHRAERTVDYCRDHRPEGRHTPRRDENAPRWMKAIYGGKCGKCWKFVKIGERMLWFKKQKQLFCESCGKAYKEISKSKGEIENA